MKIAIVSENGQTISKQLGQAPYYLVYTVESGKIVNRETRSKPSLDQIRAMAADESPHQRRGQGDAAREKYFQLTRPIADCQVLLSGGMSMVAYDTILSLKIQPFVTILEEIETAVQEYINGTLQDYYG